jgi:hypothetical protein
LPATDADGDASTTAATTPATSSTGPGADTTAAGSGSSTGCVGPACGTCESLAHLPCDTADTSPFAAMGVGCPDELSVSVASTGSSAAIGTRSGFGPTTTWDPNEGVRFTVIGTGLVSELDSQAIPPEPATMYCNSDLGPQYDPAEFPAPIVPIDVRGDCISDPALIGTGDCSRTLQTAWDGGTGGNDYTELRIWGVTPSAATSLSLFHAFFTTEYPMFLGSQYADIYLAWLETESWTGNIALDTEGEPISMASVELTYVDDAGALPEFEGTCLRNHGGTPWLRTTAPIRGEADFTLVFAILDMTDSVLDSYAFIDGIEWGCDAVDRPTTVLAGSLG